MLFRKFKKSLNVAALWLALIVVPVGTLPAVTYAASKKPTSSTSTKKPKKAKSKAKAKTQAKSAAKCDTNYSGCVPVASDVDCKPGSGDGPAYISSAVKVLKKDIYRLDADHDGTACEKN